MWKHHIKNQHQIRTEGRGEWLKSNERTITKNVFPTFGENFAICNATMKFDWMELIAESEIFDSIEMSEFNIFVPLWIMTQFVDFFLSRSVYLEYHMIGGAHPILMSFSYLLRSKWFKSRFSSFLHFSRFLMIFTWGQHSLFKLYRLFINLSLTLAFHYVDVPILECWNRSNHITWSCRVASCCKVSCREKPIPKLAANNSMLSSETVAKGMQWWSVIKLNSVSSLSFYALPLLLSWYTQIIRGVKNEEKQVLAMFHDSFTFSLHSSPHIHSCK